MTAVHTSAPEETVADLLKRLGGIDPARVRLRPPIGTATEEDLGRAGNSAKLCELVEGTLVEKAMGFRESVLAGALIEILRQFVRARNLGIVSTPDGMVRLFPGLVRGPDVAFVSWGRLPGGRLPEQAIPAVSPDLAVEILSEGNTRAEMNRKRLEYFQAGVREVWEIDPVFRTVSVYEAAEEPVHVLGQQDRLSGGEVLPGFELSLAEFFGELDQHSGK